MRHGIWGLLLMVFSLSCHFGGKGSNSPSNTEEEILPTENLVLHSREIHGAAGGINRIEVSSEEPRRFRKDFLLDSDREWHLVVDDLMISRGSGNECREQDLSGVRIIGDWLLLDRENNNQVLSSERAASLDGGGTNTGRQIRTTAGSRYSLRLRIINLSACRSLIVEFRTRTDTEFNGLRHCNLYRDPFNMGHGLDIRTQ